MTKINSDPDWQKARASGGTNCVHVAPAWRKSSTSYSNSQCAWVAPATEGPGALVRDEWGGLLELTPGSWRALLAGVKAS